MKRFVCVLMCALCAGVLSLSAAPARAEIATTHDVEMEYLQAIVGLRARAQRNMDLMHAQFVRELDAMRIRGASNAEINAMHLQFRGLVVTTCRENLTNMNKAKNEGVKVMNRAPHNSPGRAERIMNWHWGHMGQLTVYRNNMVEDMRLRTLEVTRAVR